MHKLLITDSVDDSWPDLLQCAGWEYHRFAAGPLAHLLMHFVADAAGVLRGEAGCSTRACARLVLRDGTTFGVMASAPRVAMLEVLLTAGAALAGQRYDESDFNQLDAALKSALLAAGHGRAQVALEHNATVLPRPLLTANQIGRLALRALNTGRVERGGSALPELATCLAHRFALACSFDDAAVQAYRAALDPNAAAYQRSARMLHGIALDRLVVYNFLSTARGKPRNRVQAMAVLPWLLPMLTAPGNGRILFEVVTILQAIDDGLPLYDAVARAFGVPSAVVRWLGRRTLPHSWTLDVGRLHRLLALLSWVAPERRPQTIAQFDALTAVASALVAPLGFHDADDKPALLASYAPCMRRWLSEVTRPGVLPAAASRDLSELASELADAGDFLRALFEAVQAMDGLDHEAGKERVLRWCASIPVRRLLALSRAWHAAVTADTSDDAGRGSDLRWPAVLTRRWQYEQTTVIELTSSAQLRTEGRALQHCVGSYDTLCRSGNSMIVSLRAPSGKPASTAELYLRDGIPRVIAAQHRGVRNAVPGEECVQALAALLGYLNSADNLEPLRQRQDFQRRQSDKRRMLRGLGRAEQGAFSRTAQQSARRLALG